MATVFVLALVPARRVSAQNDAPPCERHSSFAVIVVGVAGEPIWRNFTPAPGVEPFHLFVTPITVDRMYRGIDASIVYLKLDSWPALELGRRYLVGGFTNFGKAHELVSFGLAEPVEHAAADLAFLDAAALSRSGGTIYGKLSSGRIDDSNWPRKPLTGVTVRFVSEGSTIETVTADDGQFAVTGIPEGFVRIEPLLPDGWQGGGGSQVRHGGCYRFGLVAELNGRLRGRVLHADGTPMTWMVDLLPVDPREAILSSRRMSVRANKSGDFEFAGLQPGEYLIGVNLLRPSSPGAPYPPTYFPGVINRHEAVPMVVGAGTVHGGVDFTLRDSILKGQLEIRVESEAGPGKVSVCVRNISSATGTDAVRIPAVTGQPVTIAVLDGARYQLLGQVERGKSHFESEVVEVAGTALRQTLTLRANRRVPTQPPGMYFCTALLSR